jgi:hypothetical protein
MSIQHHLLEPVIRADPWTLFCTECSQKMRIIMSIPTKGGRETRTYECISGHRESISIALH